MDGIAQFGGDLMKYYFDGGNVMHAISLLSIASAATIIYKVIALSRVKLRLSLVIAKVVDKFVMQLETQLGDRNVTIELSDEARNWLTDNGYDEAMGARPMARVIQEHIKTPLADEVLFGRLKGGGIVRVVVAKGDDGKEKLAFVYPDGPALPRPDKEVLEAGKKKLKDEPEVRKAKRSKKPGAKKSSGPAGSVEKPEPPKSGPPRSGPEGGGPKGGFVPRVPLKS